MRPPSLNGLPARRNPALEPAPMEQRIIWVMLNLTSPQQAKIMLTAPQGAA